MPLIQGRALTRPRSRVERPDAGGNSHAAGIAINARMLHGVALQRAESGRPSGFRGAPQRQYRDVARLLGGWCVVTSTRSGADRARAVGVVGVASGVLFAVLTVLTAWSGDWLERIFGLSPDGGSGETEWLADPLDSGAECGELDRCSHRVASSEGTAFHPRSTWSFINRCASVNRM